MIETADPIMLSALQHFSYCPRQCALIHLEQTFDDKVHTARGNSVHKQVDDPGYDVKHGVRVERALPVYSDKYGLIGKCDRFFASLRMALVLLLDCLPSRE
jgi:CRISPR-associated exonuclease Cas4